MIPRLVLVLTAYAAVQLGGWLIEAAGRLVDEDDIRMWRRELAS